MVELLFVVMSMIVVGATKQRKGILTANLDLPSPPKVSLSQFEPRKVL
jgi:hypothetical protein